MSLIIAMLMLGIIIMIHEFGHFLFAKLNGIGAVSYTHLDVYKRQFPFHTDMSMWLPEIQIRNWKIME